MASAIACCTAAGFLDCDRSRDRSALQRHFEKQAGICVRIAVPGSLSKQEREALEKLQEIERSDHGDPREKLFQERAG